MNIKYHDALSIAIVGVVVFAVANWLFFNFEDVNGVVHLAFGYFTGCFVNTLGLMLQPFYYKATIGGYASHKLLTVSEGRAWTGCSKVRFYEAREAIDMLKEELNDPSASNQKMFECALKKANDCLDSRVQVFNAQFVGAQTTLTGVIIMDMMCGFRFYDKWQFWAVAIALLLIAGMMFRWRAFYYAKEVLNEYLRRRGREVSQFRELDSKKEQLLSQPQISENEGHF